MAIFSKNSDFIGLDIGSTAVRLVQLRRGSEHPALVAYGSVALTGNVGTSDAKIDQDKLSEAIIKLLHDNNVTAGDVVAGLPSSKVFASVITTPKLDHDQLSKAIKYQAEQYIPMAIDQVKLDWTIIDQSADGKSYEVLLIAAQNNVIDRYVSVLENAGLDPLALEANAIAVSRSLASNSSSAMAILDFGSQDSDISIIYKNTPRLIRSVAVGSKTLVRAVSQGLGLDEAQADQFTYKFGLTQDKLEGQVLKALKPMLDNLVSEIDKSAKFFLSNNPEVKIEKLIVTGGAASLPELGPFLANSTGLPVEFGNAWACASYPQNLQDTLMGLSSQYAVAVGLASRGLTK